MTAHEGEGLAPEGVAAPLEPSALQFVDEFTKGCDGLTEVDKILMAEIAQRWAAAVSKNLQQSVEQLCGDLKAILYCGSVAGAEKLSFE